MNDPKIIKTPATDASAQSGRLFIEGKEPFCAAGYGLRRHQPGDSIQFGVDYGDQPGDVAVFNGRRAS